MGNSNSGRSINLKIITKQISKAGIETMIWRLKFINKSIKIRQSHRAAH